MNGSPGFARPLHLAMAALAVLGVISCAARDTGEDPYLWLEEIRGERALAWAQRENERSLPLLEADPRFGPMKAEALAILNSKARIPSGSIHEGAVYNFWQDESHVRGLWRRASVASFTAGAPRWETLIDYDALAAREGMNWVAGERVCLSPEYRRCMVELADDGKDASYWREFDSVARQFVPGGFELAEAKQAVAWVDRDTLLVATDWGAGTLTESGYPSTVRIWKRGTALASLPVLFAGQSTDVGVWPRVEIEDGIAHVFVQRSYTFFETAYHYAAGAQAPLARLPLPGNADLAGVLDGRAIFLLREDWTHRGMTFPLGAVVAYDPRSDRAEQVMRAAGNQSIQSVGVGKSSLIVQYLEDVSGKAARVSRNAGGEWSTSPIPLPASGVVKVQSAGGGTDDALLTFESLTTPQSLHHVTARNDVLTVLSMPASFDASDVVVQQRFAASQDGTRVPYYVMAKRAVLEAGDAPTVQYAYGGFLDATLPVYYEDPSRPQHGALAGKLWVSRGGVLVLSNIRGGSEYGPGWHQAALKEHRQRAFDDFVAISRDLIAQGVTSPAKLGAIGRSNGGLLMGVVMTQHPELYGAIVNGVPLFDMKRLKQLGAGASWVGEYGDPESRDWDEFIAKYSPYQNLRREQRYPQLFLYTATADDRVHPAHARKAGARLRELGHDFYYYENMDGGHSGAANQEQLAHRIALEYAFFAKVLMPPQ